MTTPDDHNQETFIGEDRWCRIRIHSSMVPRIKYIAAYRTAPVSAITHVAPVKGIERWKDTSKYVLDFTEPANEVGPGVILGEKHFCSSVWN